jgi:hypothetical protein
MSCAAQSPTTLKVHIEANAKSLVRNITSGVVWLIFLIGFTDVCLLNYFQNTINGSIINHSFPFLISLGAVRTSMSSISKIIHQIKEKFGELRFYYSGGDEQVAGMVRFAEYLCSKTCEVSGEKGKLCIRGNWYKTLSENTRNTDIYKDYKPI